MAELIIILIIIIIIYFVHFILSTLELHASNFQSRLHNPQVSFEGKDTRTQQGLLLKATSRKPWIKDQKGAAAMGLYRMISVNPSNDTG